MLLWHTVLPHSHGVCGIVGCIMTGIFAASSLGGVGFAEGVTMGHQLLVQLESIARFPAHRFAAPVAISFARLLLHR